MAIIGIDIGGTNIDIGIINNKGKVLYSDNIPSLVQQGPESCIERITHKITELINNNNFSRDQQGGSRAGTIFVKRTPSPWVGLTQIATLSERFCEDAGPALRTGDWVLCRQAKIGNDWLFGKGHSCHAQKAVCWKSEIDALIDIYDTSQPLVPCSYVLELLKKEPLCLTQSNLHAWIGPQKHIW